MNETLSKAFPYKCQYLKSLRRNRKWTVEYIEQTTNDMQEWLALNVTEGRANNYFWDNEESVLCKRGLTRGYFAPTLHFRYQIDLLAFRLRWGV